jgi:hypothetical protein
MEAKVKKKLAKLQQNIDRQMLFGVSTDEEYIELLRGWLEESREQQKTLAAQVKSWKIAYWFSICAFSLPFLLAILNWWLHR